MIHTANEIIKELELLEDGKCVYVNMFQECGGYIKRNGNEYFFGEVGYDGEKRPDGPFTKGDFLMIANTIKSWT
jgi:hypothetical protein